MKKILLSTLATITLLVSGCGIFEDKKAKKYTEYIEAAMDATYYGDDIRYINLADTTINEAQELYEYTIDYLAESIMLYNDVSIDYISDDIYKKYQNLAKEALKKAKYTVNTAVKVDGIYQVKVEIKPLAIWESTNDDVEEYINEFNKKYPNSENMTNDEILAAEDEYANEILKIITPYVNDMKYKETVSKIVEIKFDDEGLYGITEEDWNDIDDYVMGIK